MVVSRRAKMAETEPAIMPPMPNSSSTVWMPEAANTSMPMTW